MQITMRTPKSSYSDIRPQLQEDVFGGNKHTVDGAKLVANRLGDTISRPQLIQDVGEGALPRWPIHARA